MVDTIFRSPTEQERADFRPIGTRDPINEFRAKIAEEGQKAIKIGKPFAYKAALDRFNDSIKDAVEKSKRKHGYVKFEEIKLPNIDLKEFSDLKNFEIVSEGERSDPDLTKRNPGLDVRVKFTKYKFKDYNGTITVMEDGSSAIKRAQEKRQELDKEVKKK